MSAHTQKLRRFRLWGILVLILCMGSLLLLLKPVAHPTHALASTDPITVKTQTNKVTFPKAIDFSMTAQDTSSSLTQATLYLQYNGNNQDKHQISLSKPTSTASFHWDENTTSDNFAPTGTVVSYYWQLQDNAGDVHTGRTQSFTVVDARFGWQQLHNSLVALHWYGRPASFGTSVLGMATQDVKRISTDLGNSVRRPASLWIYQSSTDFNGSLPSNAYEWIGGIAFPHFNTGEIAVQDLQDDTLVRDMPHELTHLVFHQIVSQQVQVPTWFDEGLAVDHQIYHEPDMLLTFKKALQTHGLLRLSAISQNFPADANKAYLAYGQSWQLVDYMYRTFGHSKMVALTNALKNPQNTFEQDLQQALGVDQLHLENQWYLSLNQAALLPPGAVIKPLPPSKQIITINPTDSNQPWFLLIGILLIILPVAGLSYLFVYQKRRREQMLVVQQAQQIINNTFIASQGQNAPPEPPFFDEPPQGYYNNYPDQPEPYE